MVENGTSTADTLLGEKKNVCSITVSIFVTKLTLTSSSGKKFSVERQSCLVF